MRRAVLAGAAAVLLVGPTVLAFFSGGYFEQPRLLGRPRHLPRRAGRRGAGAQPPAPVEGRACRRRRPAPAHRLERRVGDLGAAVGPALDDVERLILYTLALVRPSPCCGAGRSPSPSSRSWRPAGARDRVRARGEAPARPRARGGVVARGHAPLPAPHVLERRGGARRGRARPVRAPRRVLRASPRHARGGGGRRRAARHGHLPLVLARSDRRRRGRPHRAARGRPDAPAAAGGPGHPRVRVHGRRGGRRLPGRGLAGGRHLRPRARRGHRPRRARGDHGRLGAARRPLGAARAGRARGHRAASRRATLRRRRRPGGGARPGRRRPGRPGRARQRDRAHRAAPGPSA